MAAKRRGTILARIRRGRPGGNNRSSRPARSQGKATRAQSGEEILPLNQFLHNVTWSLLWAIDSLYLYSTFSTKTTKSAIAYLLYYLYDYEDIIRINSQ